MLKLQQQKTDGKALFIEESLTLKLYQKQNWLRFWTHVEFVGLWDAIKQREEEFHLTNESIIGDGVCKANLDYLGGLAR